MAASAVDNQLELVAMSRKSLGQKAIQTRVPCSGAASTQLWRAQEAVVEADLSAVLQVCCGFNFCF